MIILLTGAPRIGKTTIIKKVVSKLKEKGYPLKGFYTEEIREKGKRVGFKLVTLDGIEKILAHISIKSRYKVGKYGVDIKAIDKVLDTIYPTHIEEIIIIDEIGKMECFSEKFKKIIYELLKKDNPILGTISLKGNFFIENIKKLPEVQLLFVTKENRENIPSILIDRLQR